MLISEKDVQRKIDYFREKLKRGQTKEEALQSLQRAGILDENGKHTEPYKHLGALVEKLSKKNV